MKHSFLETLVDQIERDVRRSFEHERVQTKPSSLDQEASYWRLVGQLNFKLGGPRTGSTESPKSNPKRGSSVASPAQNFETSHLKLALGESQNSVWPQTQCIKSKAALEELSALGLRFTREDLSSHSVTGVTRNALERERKKMLLRLHPDRLVSRDPNTNSTLVHERYVRASKLFADLLARTLSI